MAEETVTRKRLGEMLIQAKLLTPEELERALELQRNVNKRLGDILVEQGMVSPENLAMTLSLHLNLPLIDLKRHTVQPDALRLIPEEMARKHNLIPLDIIDGALGVVMDDPADIQVIEELTARAGMPVRPMVGVKADIEAAIDLGWVDPLSTGLEHRGDRTSGLFNLGVTGSSYLKFLPILGGSQGERRR